MALFRPHTGSLALSMSQQVEIKDKDELLAKIKSDLTPLNFKEPINNNTVKISFTGHDPRIDWDTYSVFVDGYGLFGQVNADLT